MIYLKCEWHHSSSSEPILLYSELDSSRWERRKVEIFRDGRMGYADTSSHSASTNLGMEPVPSLEEIASQEEFFPTEITQQEFEAVWNLAKKES